MGRTGCYAMLQVSKRECGVSHAVETSCGVLIVNFSKQILLGHVPDKKHWEIPKGHQEYGETTLEAARRELREETGLRLNEKSFEDLGDFIYKPHKKLHLYRIYAADGYVEPERLVCTSFFSTCTGQDIVALDRFCWAPRELIGSLCPPRLADLLLSIDW